MVNYWAILVCAIASLVVGSIWFGPMFGKMWMKIVGANHMDAEARKKMQKAAMPLYIVQFFLSLLQAYVLALYIQGLAMNGVHNAIWIWAAFVMPTVAGSAMWTNEDGKTKWARFLIQAGFQLVVFIIFGFILTSWK